MLFELLSRIGKNVCQIQIVIIANWSRKRERPWKASQPLHVRNTDSNSVCKLLLRWWPIQFCGQPCFFPAYLCSFDMDMGWQADRASCVLDSPHHGLLNPPCSQGAELVASAWIELLNSTDQPNIALLHQIHEFYPISLIVPSDIPD